PQREVVAQKLHDERGVLVGIFVEGIKLGDGVVEGRLGQLAGLLRRVLDLIVKDGEVEGQTQADGMCGLHMLLADLVGLLIGLLGVEDNTITLVTRRHFRKVAEVVAFHFQVEDLTFLLGIITTLHEKLVQQVKNILLANGLQLLLYLLTVSFHHGLLLLAPITGRLLLDTGDDTPGRAPRSHHVLVGHGQQVPLLVGQRLIELGHL
uniref:Uncharacterized protein n=1 Tax=Petromyzon marinus TaxID=7757 RepID=S4RL07_PETMA